MLPLKTHNKFTLKIQGTEFPNFRIFQIKSVSGLSAHFWDYKYATLFITFQEKLIVITEDENSAADCITDEWCW